MKTVNFALLEWASSQGVFFTILSPVLSYNGAASSDAQRLVYKFASFSNWVPVIFIIASVALFYTELRLFVAYILFYYL